MTISTYYLNCEYDFEKEEEKNAFKEKVEMTLNRMRFQIALKEKEQFQKRSIGQRILQYAGTRIARQSLLKTCV